MNQNRNAIPEISGMQTDQTAAKGCFILRLICLNARGPTQLASLIGMSSISMPLEMAESARP